MFAAVRRGQFLARALGRSSLARPAAISISLSSLTSLTPSSSSSLSAAAAACIAKPSALALADLSKHTFSTSAAQWAYGRQDGRGQRMQHRGGRGGSGNRRGGNGGGGGSRREPAEELKADVIEANEITKFQHLAEKNLVSPKVIDIITQDMGLENMTDVQRLTINATLLGNDVLAQAKTGTGKTLGFLIPVIQNMLKDPSLEGRRGLWSADHSDIRAIVISPTRELAEQIAVEARKIVKKTGIVVQTAVGGNQKREALNRMQREGCHVLIGTPGRLIDIFSDPRSGVSAPKLQCLVLDEADRLLDDGFAPDIAELQRYFPKREEFDRQTLMFSATVPREVSRMVRQTMKHDFKFVKTVDDNETPTHLAVPQKLVFLKGLENEMPALIELFNRAIREQKADPENTRPFKPIVYFNSTAEVSLAMEAYQNIVSSAMRENPRPENIPCLDCTEMHSRLTQSARTRNSNYFRNSKTCILFSSDVTARGMDFPNVTHVIQVGIPRDRETYIHRLGRTARANRKGEGWLFVHDVEFNDLRGKLSKLPLEEDTSLKAAELDLSKPESAGDEQTVDMVKRIKTGFELIPLSDKYDAYRAYFGVYGATNKKRLVEMMNTLTTKGWGLEEPMKIPTALAMRLGLRNVPGVHIGEMDFPRHEPRNSRDRERYGNDQSFFGRSDSRFGDHRSIDRFGDSRGGRDGRDGRGGRGGRGGRFGDQSGPRRSFGDQNGPRRSFDDQRSSALFDKFGDDAHKRASDLFSEASLARRGRQSFGRGGGDKARPNKQPHWIGRGARN
ncbi:hypothetical protein KEM54_001252 [Ascosphaera aggregata]|nr:hypothetical protein KEM54_001252 [Ascosphaera aggregata]